MLRLFDSASAEIRPFVPAQEGVVRMYVCGPTVYGRPHLGHGRFVLVFDVLRRYLLWSGNDVTYVSNVTDVDDKIIDRAAAEGRDWTEVVAEFEAVWWEATDGLGVLRPDETPHATAYIDQMVALIERLVAEGAAYELDDGVYFRTASVESYGLLARQSLDSLKAGARIGVDTAKEQPTDFALWKKAAPGELSWPSPFGPGRPGWHTECVVMSLDLLGDGFDLHGGGLDLRFPHHENERAQAVADGCEFARHWVHNGFVEMDGEKMSKSIGNVLDLPDLLERHDPRAYRMVVLQAHYRSPVDVTPASIAQAEATLARLDALVRRARAAELWPEGPLDLAAAREAGADSELLDLFIAHMDDDLDSPGAVAALFNAVTEINRLFDADEPAAAAPLAWSLASALSALGLDWSGDDGVPEDISALVAAREAARANRDFGEADRIRGELGRRGWIVEDAASGSSVHRA